MVTTAYSYFATPNKTRFVFESQGVQGRIMKIIQFTPIEGDEWNLGFGDWRKGRIDDLTISNNQDIVKVLSTVAQATYQFFDAYPNSIVVIEPVDEKRKRLYNRLFQRHFNDIDHNFHIIGIIEREPVLYEPNMWCDCFKIMLKTKTNE